VRPALDLLRADRRAQVFFATQAQSAFGTGAGYVALLLIAYERFESPWAITTILLAEFLPAMFLGPFVGAAADRWSRKALLVAADVVRAAAFIGLVVVGSFEATVALALLAGTGNAIFNPTVMAALPRFFGQRRFAAATAMHNAIREIGFTAGPALAALAFVVVSAERLMIVNAISFAISAAVLTLLCFGREAPSSSEQPRGRLLDELKEGVAVVTRHAGVRSLLTASSAIVISMGMINVGELLLARDALGSGDSGFSILVATMGAGIAAGSLLGSAGRNAHRLSRGFLRGLWLCAVAAIAAGLAPNFAVAVAAFAVMGIGNGAILTNEGVLLQSVVPDELLGRLFGLKNALVSWCYAASFFSAGAIASALGPRALFVVAGAGTLVAWAAASVALRAAWPEERDAAQREPRALPAPAKAVAARAT
jgi:MFS family permease